MVDEIIPKKLGMFSSSLHTAKNQGPLFHCSIYAPLGGILGKLAMKFEFDHPFQDEKICASQII